MRFFLKIYINIPITTDETWSWEDGTPIQFVNWSPNEPNGDSSSQACVEAFHQTNPGEWNDHSCEEAQYYICKMPMGKLKITQFDSCSPHNSAASFRF